MLMAVVDAISRHLKLFCEIACGTQKVQAYFVLWYQQTLQPNRKHRMDSQDLDKIKDRIAKLLRMASDVSSPNEAAIAAQRARSLMDKYQIDAFDVGNRIAEDFASENVSKFYADIPTYMSTLAVRVAQYNDCQAKFTPNVNGWDGIGKPDKCITFSGYKTDVDLAKQMFNQLIEVVNRLCKEYLTANGHTTYVPSIGIQFKVGAFLIINDRLHEMTAKRDAITSGNGTALVVVKKASVDAHFGNPNYTKAKTLAARGANAESARLAGIAKGRSVEIVKSVGD